MAGRLQCARATPRDGRPASTGRVGDIKAISRPSPPLDRGADDLGQAGREFGEPVGRVQFGRAGLQTSPRQQPSHAVPDRGEYLGHGRIAGRSSRMKLEPARRAVGEDAVQDLSLIHI